MLNAVEFYGEPIGSVIAIGPGAGGGATSSAVLSDIIDIAHDRGGMPPRSWAISIMSDNTAEDVAPPPAPGPIAITLPIGSP